MPAATRRTRIKFCGMTAPEDVAMAVEAGADAVGFILAPSERQISVERARELSEAVPPYVGIVAVVVDPTDEALLALRIEVPRLVFQFCGNEPAPQCERSGRPYLRVMHVRPSGGYTRAQLDAYLQTYRSGMLMFDSAGGAGGGTGRTFAWNVAAMVSRDRPIVVAGGLTAENVGACIREVRPYGVDTRSGVERGGVKDREKMRAFVRAVREADADARA